MGFLGGLFWVGFLMPTLGTGTFGYSVTFFILLQIIKDFTFSQPYKNPPPPLNTFGSRQLSYRTYLPVLYHILQEST